METSGSEPMAGEVGGEVEFVDADEQVRRVLEIECEGDGGVRVEQGGRAGGEADAGFLLEVLELGGIEELAPAVRVFPGEQAGAGMQAGEALFLDEGREVLGGIGLAEEVLEVGLDEREVVAHGRAAGGGGEVGIELDAIRGRVFRDAEQRVALARQGEEGEEVVLREIAEFLLEAEVVEEDVGLERVLRGRQGERVVAAAGEVRGVGLEVAREIGLGAGAELGEVGEVEGAVRAEFRDGSPAATSSWPEVSFL